MRSVFHWRLALLAVLAAVPLRAAAPAEPLVWSTLTNTVTAKSGAISAHLFFSATNVSKEEVIINEVKASCGCTAAKLPGKPWRLAPGESGTMELTVDLRGKSGTLTKGVSVQSATAPKELMIEVMIPPGSTSLLSPEAAARLWNQEMATADRQAVFQGDCVKCHLEPVFGKRQGLALYKAACGICHDSPHRATMVPDLNALKIQSTTNYWRDMVAHGKQGTLMPGSAATEGGALDDEQIEALTRYFLEKYPAVKTADAAAKH
jgi:mono/diheme cytochrome c family protein